MNKIQKIFSYSQDLNIWRILISELEQVVIEERDINKKEVFFSCIELESGKLVWKNKIFENEKFWIGIEGTKSKYLFLHMFEKPDMPAHKKILTVDLTSGDLAWKNDDLTFYGFDDDFVYAFNKKLDSREFFKLKIADGEMVASLGNEEEAKVILDNLPEYDYSKYKFANMVGENPDFQLQREIIQKVIGENKFLSLCEFIETDKYLVFNYYDKVAQWSLVNRLVVFAKSEEIPSMIETVNSSTPAPVPDSFFLYKNFLIFIKDKKELNVYSLN